MGAISASAGAERTSHPLRAPSAPANAAVIVAAARKVQQFRASDRGERRAILNILPAYGRAKTPATSSPLRAGQGPPPRFPRMPDDQPQTPRGAAQPSLAGRLRLVIRHPWKARR